MYKMIEFRKITQYIGAFVLFLCLSCVVQCSTEADALLTATKYKIEGKILVPFTADQEWIGNTRVLVDGGRYLGFIRSDGSFAVENIPPSGTYIVEVANPTYAFEPMRVDVNSKGKIRARRLNHIQPHAVAHLTYPLKFKARGKASYFQQREQWRITDMLMNPMVLMMVLPFLMIMVLPKLMNTADPETQKEMQSQLNSLNYKQSVPDMSELLTNFLGGGQQKKPTKATTKAKRRS